MRGNGCERRGWMRGNGRERRGWMRWNTSEQALVDVRERERAAARMMTHIDVRKRMRVLVQERTVQERATQPFMWCNRSCGATVPERYSGSPA